MTRRISWSRYFSFNSILSRTKRRASGIVSCSEQLRRRRDTMPIGCKVRGIPKTDIGSTRRKSCSIPMRKSYFSRLTFREKRRGIQVGTMGVRCSEYCLVREAEFDWGTQLPPRHRHDAIVYELHVKGFTARANSGVAKEKRGTFLGLIEKIPYLKELGVTVVELLPVHQFDPQEGNYWGYMTLELLRAAPRLRSAATRSQSFGRWSERFMRREWKFGWTLFTTTPPKATKLGRCIRTAVSIIAAITC